MVETEVQILGHMSTKISVFTPIQSEYWKREFGENVAVSEFDSKSILNSIKQKNATVVYVDEITLKKLENLKLPKDSIIGFLGTDENYNLSLNSSVLKANFIKFVLRPYPLYKFTLKKLTVTLFSNCYEFLLQKKFGKLKNFARWAIEGFGMTIRQSRIRKIEKKLGKHSVSIPLGYTDLFCRSFLKIFEQLEFKNSKEKSLLRISANLEICQLPKKYNFVFVGQKGHLVRQIGTFSAKKRKQSFILERSGYGAGEINSEEVQNNGMEYVNSLINSKFSVCPPGNISGNSYRIMESLICGSYPVVKDFVLCDPLFESPNKELVLVRKPILWRSYLKKLEKANSREIQRNIEINLDCEIKKMKEIKSFLESVEG